MSLTLFRHWLNEFFSMKTLPKLRSIYSWWQLPAVRDNSASLVILPIHYLQGLNNSEGVLLLLLLSVYWTNTHLLVYLENIYVSCVQSGRSSGCVQVSALCPSVPVNGINMDKGGERNSNFSLELLVHFANWDVNCFSIFSVQHLL